MDGWNGAQILGCGRPLGDWFYSCNSPLVTSQFPTNLGWHMITAPNKPKKPILLNMHPLTPSANVTFPQQIMTRLALLLLGLLEHLLDDLLLLNQEGANDAVPDAVGAPRTTIGALDGLLGAGDGGVLAGTEGRNLLDVHQRLLEIQYSANCVVQAIESSFL